MTANTDFETVLRRRAEVLAKPVRPCSDAEAGPLLEVLEFRIGEEVYAVETAFVQSVQPLRHLTEVPCTPAFILGIVNVRGRIVTVVDLRRLFRMRDEGINDLHRIILLGSRDIEFGLLADISVGIRQLEEAALNAAPLHLSDVAQSYVRGITSEGVILLDGNRILTATEILVDEEPAERG